MKRHLISTSLILIFTLVLSSIFAQPISSPYQIIPELHPTRTIRIAFHIIHKYDVNDTTHIPNDSLTQHWFERRMDSLNHYLRTPPLPNHECYKGPAYTTKIQVELIGVYFHADSNFFIDKSLSQYYNRFVRDNPSFGRLEKDSVLHTFYNGQLIFGGIAGGVPSRLGIRFEGRLEKYQWWKNYEPIGTHDVDFNYIHELAHCLGLHHNFKNSPEYSWNECSGCDARVGKICFTPKKSTAPNNTMYKGPNRPRGESFTHCQLQRIIYYSNGMDSTIRGSMQDISMCAKPVHSTYTAVISENDTLTYDHSLNGSLIVDTSAVLTVNSKLVFPKNARLILKPGSKLVVDQGNLFTMNNSINKVPIERLAASKFWWLTIGKKRAKLRPGQLVYINTIKKPKT